MHWKLAEAKNRLSEVLNLVDDNEPQVITRKGKDYIVLAGDEYRHLKGEKPNLIDVILDAPSLEGIDLERDRTGERMVDL